MSALRNGFKKKKSSRKNGLDAGETLALLVQVQIQSQSVIVSHCRTSAARTACCSAAAVTLFASECELIVMLQ